MTNVTLKARHQGGDLVTPSDGRHLSPHVRRPLGESRNQPDIKGSHLSILLQ